MKRIHKFALAGLLSVWFMHGGNASAAEFAELPGISSQTKGRDMIGSLSFFYADGSRRDGSKRLIGEIYTINLADGKLIKHCDAPSGMFYCSNAGDVFAIRPFSNPATSPANKLWVYGVKGSKSINVELDGAVEELEIIDDWVVCVVEKDLNRSLYRFNLEQHSPVKMSLPNAAEWSGAEYSQLHLAPGAKDKVHVLYRFSGDRLREGVDYKSGFYSIEMPSGKFQWFAGTTEDNDDTQFNVRDFDGRFIFFEGEDSMSGGKLLSSQRSYWDYKINKKGSDSVRTLHQFPRKSLFKAENFQISQMSPDGIFVLVREQLPCLRKGLSEYGWLNNYYAVNATNGNCTLIVKEEVARLTSGTASRLVWTH